MKNKKTIEVRLAILEAWTHPPLVSPERIDKIEKSIQEIAKKVKKIEELLEPSK